jgi:hypothetical protein
VKASLKAAARVVHKARSHPSAESPAWRRPGVRAQSITDAQGQLKENTPLRRSRMTCTGVWTRPPRR